MGKISASIFLLRLFFSLPSVPYPTGGLWGQLRV